MRLTLGQLGALLTAGAITPDAYAKALSDGTKPQLQLRIPVAQLELPADDAEGQASRTLSGVASRYEQLIPSHGMVIHTGALQPRQPLDKSKLLVDHDHAQPVGYLLSYDPDTLAADWYVAEGAEGDKALADAAAKLRDGLSVGFTCLPDGWELDEDWTLHVWAADWYETSLCAIPAVADAGVTNVAAALATNREKEDTVNREQLAAALTAGTITKAQHDARLGQLQAAEAELAVGPDVSAGIAPVAQVTTRPGEALRQAVSAVRSAMLQARSSADVALALATITPASDAAKGYTRPEWIGEVWQATSTGRPWIESLGSPLPLTSTKVEGFTWEDTPTPAKFAIGVLAELPSNGMSTKPVSAEPEAWGWSARIDRVFTDLGSDDLLGALFAKLAVNYDKVSDFDVAAKLLTGATVEATPYAGVLPAIKGLARSFRAVGANLDQLWLAEDVFDAWSDLGIDDLPAWLANQAGFVNLRNGESTVGDFVVKADSRLADGQVAAYDKRAATVRESAAIRLEAIALPNNGLDVGFINYGGVLVNDKRALRTATVTLP